MTKLLDISGKQFGKLTAINISTRNPRVKWNCVCSCGNHTVVISAKLVNGHTKSCGCKIYETKNITHGMSKTKAYNAWRSMKGRCKNPQNTAYINYGGRGITICDHWINSFENFYADMGECPPDKSIERINNDLGYSPDNCKWAEIYEQANNKRDSVNLEYRGVTKTLPQWSRIFCINMDTLRSRISSGRSLGDIFDWQ